MRLSYKKKLRFIAEQGGKCAYCGCELDMTQVDVTRIPTWDHFVPLSKGGGNESTNLVIACMRCNLQKDRRDDVAMPEILRSRIEETASKNRATPVDDDPDDWEFD